MNLLDYLTPEEIEAQLRANPNANPMSTSGIPVLEAAGTLGANAVMEALSGWAGLLGLGAGGSLDDSVNIINNVQSKGYQPRLPETRQLLGSLQPVGEAFERASQVSGDFGYDEGQNLLSNELGALYYALPQIAPDLLGLGVVGRLGRGGRKLDIGDIGTGPMQSERGAMGPIYTPSEMTEAEMLASRLELGQAGPYDPTAVKTPAQFVPEALRRTNFSPVTESGFRSKLRDSLLDIQENRGEGDVVTGPYLLKQLEGRGISNQELSWSNIDPMALQGQNKVSISGLLGDLQTVEDRMGIYRENTDITQPSDEMNVTDLIYDEGTFNTLSREDAYGIDYGEDRWQLFESGDWIAEAMADWVTKKYGASDDVEITRLDEIREAYNASSDSDEFVREMDNLYSGFEDEFDRLAQLNADEAYNDNPISQYSERLEDADGQYWDLDITGSDDTGYSISIDGTDRTPRNGIYSENEAILQARDALLEQGFMEADANSGVNYTTEDWTIGELDEDAFRENIVITMNDLEFGPYDSMYNHWSNETTNPVAHMRASEREIIDPTDPNLTESVYFVDEMQSDLHSDARKAGTKTDPVTGKKTYNPQYKSQATEQRLWAARDKVDALEQEKRAAGQEITRFFLNEVNAEQLLPRLFDQEQIGSAVKQHISEADVQRARELFGDQVIPPEYRARFGTTPQELRQYQLHTEPFLLEKLSSLSLGELQRNGFTELSDKAIARLSNRAQAKLGELASANGYEFDGEYPIFENYIKAVNKYDAARQEAAEASTQAKGPPPAPLGDDKWINGTMKQAIIRAIERGHDRVVFANADNQVSVWGERSRAGYENVYDKRLPDLLKKFGAKYGVKPERVRMSDETMNEKEQYQETVPLYNWSIKITPEMKEQIKQHGLDLYGKINKGLLSPTQEQEQRLGGLLG